MNDYVIDSGEVIGPPFLGFKLLKTGQTTKYVTGDDGDLEVGEAKGYETLTTGQFSGTTAITINGKTDNHSNNVVKDLKTGLMWSRYVSDSVGPGSDGKLPWTTNEDGEGIFPYVAAANVAGLAGYLDWRIPNISEALGIKSAETFLPDPIAFTGFNSIIWSNTTRSDSTTNAWCSLTNNYWASGTEKDDVQAVLLVRGGN